MEIWYQAYQGKSDFLSNLLSRPTTFNIETIHLFQKGTSIIPTFLMVHIFFLFFKPIMSSKQSSKRPEFPNPSSFGTLPKDIKENIIHRHLKERMQSIIYSCIDYGLLGRLWPMVIHPEYPYFTIFDLTIPSHFPKSGYVLLENFIKKFGNRLFV